MFLRGCARSSAHQHHNNPTSAADRTGAEINIFPAEIAENVAPHCYGRFWDVSWSSQAKLKRANRTSRPPGTPCCHTATRIPSAA